MSDVPLGICREILLRLPAEALFRLRAVCKRWRAVIDDPCFVRAHTNNQLSSNTLLLRNSTGPPFYPLYYFNLEALNFNNGPQTIPVTPLKLTRSGLSRLPALPVAACNGLILVVPMDPKKNWVDEINLDPKGTWEIWNPLTHERLKLPQPNIKPHVLGTGLGYDCAHDDYKAVVIDDRRRRLSGEHAYRTHVYSLKSDSWRKIGNCPFGFGFPYQNIQQGVFMNGALYWISRDRIIALDLGTENYRQLSLPSLHWRREQESMRLDSLGGCLFLSYYGADRYTKQFDVWVMLDVWKKLFSLNGYQASYLDRNLRPVAYIKSKKQVLLQHYYGFSLFDVESNSMKMVSIHGFSENYSAQICLGSLVRLHDSCGSVGAKRRTRKRKRRMKMADTKLTFCVRDYDEVNCGLHRPHDSCYSSDSSWYNSSSEG